MPPSIAVQLILMALTGVLFAAAFLLGLRHMRRANALQTPEGAGGGGMPVRLPHEASMGVPARSAVAAGTVMGLGLFLWRMLAGEHPFAIALTNPFDAFLVLGLLLALMVVYFRRTRHLRSLSFFLLPMIVILLMLGVVLAAVHSGAILPTGERHTFGNIWTSIHVTAIVAATLCFALGCVGAAVYLLADRQLRRRGTGAAGTAAPALGWLGFPPLASVEKFDQAMIYCGFPLLTVATFAGILRITQAGSVWGAGEIVKLGCGVLSWVIYLVLLHVPLNPRFRGRRAAWLSILGFGLFIGAYLAAKWS